MAHSGSVLTGVVVVGGWLTATSCTHAGALYMVRVDDRMLRVVDTDTLEVTDIGTLGVSVEFAGLAWDDDAQRLFMVTGFEDENLYEVDASNGQTTRVGTHGVEDLFGLTWDRSANRLFAGRSTRGTGLYLVSPSDVEADLVGDPGIDLDGLAYDSNRDMLIGASAGPGDLYEIDREDGSATLIFNGPFFNNGGMTYDSQKDLLWYVDRSGNLYSFDPGNGYARTRVLTGLGPHDGLAFVVEPPPIDFREPLDVALARGASAVASTDFTGTGANDIAVPLEDEGGGPGQLMLLLNDGSGRNYLKVLTPVGVNPTDVAVGDFDGKLGPDAAVTNGADGTVTILLNDGEGNGTFMPEPQVVPVGAMPAAIAAGRIDGDAFPDLAIANKGDNSVSILINDGTGVFAEDLDPLPTGAQPSGVSLAELDVGAAPGDGAEDMAVTEEGEDGVRIFGNDGDGEFDDGFRIPVGAGPMGSPPRDFDDDKDVDLAVYHESSADGDGDEDATVTLLLNDGAGNFAPMVLEVGERPSSLEPVDIEGDGDVDLLVVAKGSEEGLRSVRVVRSRFADLGLLEFDVVDDLAPDRQLQLVTANRMDVNTTPDVIVVERTRGIDEGAVRVLLNESGCPGDLNGDGLIGTLDIIFVLAAWGDCPDCPEDLNGDGEVSMLDLVQVLSSWGKCEDDKGG